MGLGVTHYARHKPPPWYDYGLAISLVVILVYFTWNSEAIAMRMWNLAPGTLNMVLAVIIGLISLEAGRRIGGWPYVGLLGVSIVYPLVADYMPGIFWGVGQSIGDIFGDFAFGANGLLGIPAMMLAELVLGFYLFAGVVMGMGCGEFFVKLATSLVGRFRGGPAKVSSLASAFFGTMSGSTIANIVGTGSFTIPAMKKAGFAPDVAASVEACSSNIGDTMPPIMGGMVFLAAVISGVEYAEFVIAAIVPAFLYVYAMQIQIDGIAAKQGLKGLTKAEIPPLLPIIREGWMYFLVIAFLVFGLIYMRWGAITPIYAVGLSFVFEFISWAFRKVRAGIRGQSAPELAILPSARRAWSRIIQAVAQAAGLVNFVVAVTLSMGFILVGLFKTGVAAAITSWIVSLGAGNSYLILFIAAAFSLVMGMVGLQRAAFLFLSVTAAPGVSQATGVPIQLILLFIIYQAGYGALTPPVAIDAYVAASIAGSDPVKTSYTASKMAVVLFLVPFFFVFQPALAFQGPPLSIAYYLFMAMVGIFIMVSGTGGYFTGLGALNRKERWLLIPGGLLIAFPETITTVIGLALSGIGITLLVIRRAAQRREERTQALS
jgi:TRAP transporter 4TM/12TM fusion protein